MNTFPQSHIQKPDGDFYQDVHVWDFHVWDCWALPAIGRHLLNASLRCQSILHKALQQEGTEPWEPARSVGGRYTLSYKSRFQAQKMQAVTQPVTQWLPAVWVLITWVPKVKHGPQGIEYWSWTAQELDRGQKDPWEEVLTVVKSSVYGHTTLYAPNLVCG